MAAAVLLTACGGGGSTSSPGSTAAGPSATTTSVPAGSTGVSLYWVRGGEYLGVSHRSVPATGTPATAAVDALFGGTDQVEQAAGLTSAVPAGSSLLGLTIDHGVATANFNATFASGGGSFSVRARVAQVVFTLTQFPTVTRVQFQVEGNTATTFSSEGLLLGSPVGRGDQSDLLPPVFVENPAVGDTVHSPLHLAGTSGVAGSTIHLQLVDATGKTVIDRQVPTTPGNGARSAFDARIAYATGSTGAGTVTVVAVSTTDGTRTGQVVVPLTVAP